MSVNEFMKDNLDVMKSMILKDIPYKTFDSHEFIRHFMREFELDYVGFLSSFNETPFQNVNAQIGRFLSVNKIALGIKDEGKVESANVFGIESANERWTKVD